MITNASCSIVVQQLSKFIPVKQSLTAMINRRKDIAWKNPIQANYFYWKKRLDLLMKYKIFKLF